MRDILANRAQHGLPHSDALPAIRLYQALHPGPGELGGMRRSATASGLRLLRRGHADRRRCGPANSALPALLAMAGGRIRR